MEDETGLSYDANAAEWLLRDLRLRAATGDPTAAFRLSLLEDCAKGKYVSDAPTKHAQANSDERGSAASSTDEGFTLDL